MRAGKLQPAIAADSGPRHLTGFLHPDLCIAYHDPIVDGFAQKGLAQDPSAYAACVDEMYFGWSRREQSDTASNKRDLSKLAGECRFNATRAAWANRDISPDPGLTECAP